jgi:uncharacterized protein (PEP-CTERM system associated)
MRGRVLKSSIRLHAGSAVVALVGMTAGPMAVAEIQVLPRIQARQTWTDTANLDAVGQRDGDLITTISPGVQISGSTQRIQAFIDYTLNGLIFWGTSSQSDIRHNLTAAVNTEVIRDRFFVDVRGQVNQQFQNFGGQVSNIQANFTQNRGTVQNYAVTPRWREEVGDWATAQLSYTYNVTEQNNERDAVVNGIGVGFVADSTGHLARFSLRDARNGDRFGWNWNTRYNRVERVNRFQNFDLESFDTILDLSYDLTRKITFLSSIGYEDIRDDTLVTDQKGSVWDVGLRFTPGPRTSIEGRAGRRFNDTVFSGRASYRFSATDSITATYSEDITVANRNQAFIFGDREFFDADGNFIPQLPTDEVFDSDPFITDAAFRQKRANLNFTRQLRKTTLTTNAFWQKSIFSENAQNDSYGALVSGLYRIDGAQSAGMFITYRHNSFGFNRSDDFIAVSPNYTYTFSPNLTASARYNFTKRFSNLPGLARSTNSISIDLTAFF